MRLNLTIFTSTFWLYILISFYFLQAVQRSISPRTKYFFHTGYKGNHAEATQSFYSHLTAIIKASGCVFVRDFGS